MGSRFKHAARGFSALVVAELLASVGVSAGAVESVPQPLPTDGTIASPTPTSTSGDPSASPTATPVITRPGVPMGLAVTDSKVEAITLSWTPPPKDGGSPILDYRVDYKFDDFGGTLRWKTPPVVPAAPVEGTAVVPISTSVVLTNLPLQVGLTVSIRTVTAWGVSLPAKLHLTTPGPDGALPAQPAALKQASFLTSTWNSRKPGKYGYYVGVNCANWASQSLLKRGYKTTSKWHPRLSRTRGATKAWISSTALRAFMLDTGRAVELTDVQRDQVRVGDIVQFDWWNKGAKEHTGVVSAIVPTSAGLKIYYASHTAHGLYWSVDRSIQVAYPGAKVTYLSLR